MDILPSHTFRAVSYPWRLYVGADALRHLADEVRRHKAQRAFVVCGQTVAHKTNLLERVKAQLGTLYAGAFAAMDKDSSWPAVQQGTEAARAAGGVYHRNTQASLPPKISPKLPGSVSCT